MTGGSEGRDESVNFSLKELMKLEDERVDQEKQARSAREEAAKSAREAQARRERLELEARERTDADERERVRWQELEDEARRDAIQRAAVEQARITVEARTRAEESERERRHEIELQRMRAETVKKPGPGGFIGSGLGGAALAFAICFVFHFSVSKPAADKRIAELDRAVATADGRADELARRVDDQKSRISALEKDLGSAQAEIAKLNVPATAKSPTVVPFKPGPGGQPPKQRQTVDPAPCPPGHELDPLCGYIKRN